MEIMRYLSTLSKLSDLNATRPCNSRELNSGPQSLLPGGYTNEFHHRTHAQPKRLGFARGRGTAMLAENTSRLAGIAHPRSITISARLHARVTSATSTHVFSVSSQQAPPGSSSLTPISCS